MAIIQMRVARYRILRVYRRQSGIVTTDIQSSFCGLFVKSRGRDPKNYADVNVIEPVNVNVPEIVVTLAEGIAWKHSYNPLRQTLPGAMISGSIEISAKRCGTAAGAVSGAAPG